MVKGENDEGEGARMWQHRTNAASLHADTIIYQALNISCYLDRYRSPSVAIWSLVP